MKQNNIIKNILIIVVIVGLGLLIVWSTKAYFESFGTKETVETGSSTIDQAKDLKTQLNSRPETAPEAE